MAVTGASLQQIYDRLHGVDKYHPMSANTFADWSMEAGDIVTMSRDGARKASPAHSVHISWRGSPMVSINATGNEKRESIARVSRQKYGRSGAGMRNDQSVYKDLYSDDGRLHSELMYTESILRVEFDDSINSLRSEFEVTASHLYTEFTDDINSLRGELEVTASHLQTEFTDGLNSLHSELEITASHLQTEFTDETNSLRSEFEVTASRFQSELEDTASGLSSRITQTAGRVAIVVDANGNIRPAQIVAAINASWESEAILDADHVYISGTTKLSGQLTVQDGSLLVRTALLVSGSTNGNVSINNGSVNAKTHQVNAGGSILFVGGESGEYYNLTASVLKDMIKSVAVANNILTLTPFYGDPINFSKATSLTGAWDSGVYKVSARQTNYNTTTEQSETTTVATLSYDPPLRLNGSAAASNFSAEVYETPSGGSPVARKSVYGYLIFTANGANSYVDVNPNSDGSGTPVARISVGSIYTSGYNSGKTQGWSDAYAKVSIPGSNTSTNSATFKTPNAASTSNPAQNTHALSMGNDGNNAVVLYRATDSGTGVTIARFEHNKYTAGQNSVTVTDVSVYGSPAATATSISVQGTASNGATKIGSIDITTQRNNAYNSGVTAGKNAVAINKGSWNGGQISFTKSEGTASTKSVQLVAAAATWNGNTASRVIWDGTAADAQHGVSTGYTVTVDASSIYTNGYNAGYSAGSTDGYNSGYSAGVAAVTVDSVSAPAWSGTGAKKNFTVTGTASNGATKSQTYYLTNPSQGVIVVRQGNSSTGRIVARWS